MEFDLRQFADIPPVSREAWEEAVAKALGPQSLDRLRAVTSDGIVVPPLSLPRPDRAAMTARGPGRPWSIVQRVAPDHPERMNAEILDELGGGADAIEITLSSSPKSVVDLTDEEDNGPKLIRTFESVYLGMITVHLTGDDGLINISNILSGVVSRHFGIFPLMKLRIGYDPFVYSIKNSSMSNLTCDFSEDLRRLLAIAGNCGPDSSILSSLGQFWHAAGATEAQQVAIAVASGLMHLRLFSDLRGVDLDLAALSGAIEFRLVADQDQFLTMAKLRAFRRLWALVLDNLGLPNRPAFVHAETAWRSATRRDPWVNILRSTIACFAAAAGGADAITTRPHTELVGRPDAAARRLSRNVQTILMDESNLHRVADPGAGSGAVEALTDAVAEAAWAEVRRIEGEGGMIQAVASGGLMARIAAAAAARREAVARRRLPITGTSTYPLVAERTPPVEAGSAAPPPAPGFVRLAEPFERLRDRSDAALARDGRRPVVFLASLGPVAAHTARATFAKNLFEAGGIEALPGPGGEDAAALAAAFAASGARIACLCSDDATYGRLAGTAAAALAAAGAHVLLAGRPKDREAAWREAGVSGFVFDGMDVLALLEGLHHMLGTPVAA